VGYKDKSRILAIVGVPLLLAGIASAFLGPIEMYCFYLFSEGGRFHYEGFGFGSFMFGNIASQIIGYYLIAIVLIPLGYGHLKMRRWARRLALTMLYFWLVVGVPLIVVFLFILFSSKDLPPIAALIVLVLLGASYPIIPGLLIRFYTSRNVMLSFETRDPKCYWIEEHPLPILVLCCLFLFYTVVLHILIFFNGLFPFFGVFLSDIQGIFAIDVVIMCLVILTLGVFKQRVWAWWGSLAYFMLMALSSLLTLLKSGFSDILAKMTFPPTEMEILQGLPFQCYHFAVLAGIPLFLTMGLILVSKRHFEKGSDNSIQLKAIQQEAGSNREGTCA
jgi:hypothetical protein